MAKKIKYPVVKKVKLNNKTRKGIYMYVHLGKGKSPSYYKFEKGLSKKDYINLKVKGKLKYKRGGVKRGVDFETYLKKIKGRKSFSKLLKKGVYHAEIKNAMNASILRVKSTYERLLKPIVLDKEIRSIVAREENMKKISMRLSYDVVLKDKNKKMLAVISHPAEKTLKDIIIDSDKLLKRGINISDFSPSIAKSFNRMGYKYSHKNNGVLANYDVRITYRKAK